MRVMEKKTLKRERPWINLFKLDKEKTKQDGKKTFVKIPPSKQEFIRNDSHYAMAGRLDRVNVQDPDIIDPDTDLPVFRFFEKGEVFLAVKDTAIWMEYQDYAIPVSDFKNEKDDETGLVRFDWAEENEIISDENAILIPKYHERYSSNAHTVMGMAERLMILDARVKELEAEKAGV
jgi:hypothetical protein